MDSNTGMFTILRSTWGNIHQCGGWDLGVRGPDTIGCEQCERLPLESIVTCLRFHPIAEEKPEI